MRLSLDQRISLKWCFLFVILGCVLGYGAGVFTARKSTWKRGIQTLMKDEDGDGKTDCVMVYSNGLLQSVAIDRNRDGQYDYRDYYFDGKQGRSEADNNFDGRFDEWTTFAYEFPSIVETDADGDGRVDIVSYYTNGIMSAHTIRMTPGKKDFFTEYFEHGIRSKVVIKKDGKERVVTCGKYGQIPLGDD